MSDLVVWVHDDIEPVEPLLVVSLTGWIDAGGAAAAATAHLLTATSAEQIADFDTEQLIDHRARRPTMRLVDGVVEGLDWPTIELSFGMDDQGRHLLVQRGAEPDHQWHAFVDLIVDIAESTGVRRVVGLGGYPAAVPHTRPVGLSSTASTRELADDATFLNATLDVPAGIQAAIEVGAAAEGIPSMGLWAQVPHYTAGLPYPAASVALLESLDRLFGLSVDLTDLRSEAEDSQVRLGELVAANPEHAAMVTQLEADYDQTERERAELPTGEELADELERFLREQDDT